MSLQIFKEYSFALVLSLPSSPPSSRLQLPPLHLLLPPHSPATSPPTTSSSPAPPKNAREQAPTSLSWHEVATWTPQEKFTGSRRPDCLMAAEKAGKGEGGVWEMGTPVWVIANAGGAWPGFLADQCEGGKGAIEAMMEQNYMTAVNVVRATLVVAKEMEGGSVEGTKEWNVAGLCYAASKYALRGLAEGFAVNSSHSDAKSTFTPANMDTPGFAKENETKPEITAKIEGTASTMTATAAAQSLIAGGYMDVKSYFAKAPVVKKDESKKEKSVAVDSWKQAS
ncbi:hypothetical protein BC829DRAFT_416922 [Chytridium lagenaria]|nr:hypothetical protein BC829DRAFT_416922 [Chytridium lagenaria]